MFEKVDFKVGVLCFTYNQSKYIIETLNGFVLQKTSFPYICMIVDDASTDGEQDVIKTYVYKNFDFSESSISYTKETDYGTIIFSQNIKNRNCYFAVVLLKENHYQVKKNKMQYLADWRESTEYEAICEGDDYWIDENKLQLEVDFLINNADYGLCHTDYKVIGGSKPKYEYYKDNEYLKGLIVGSNCIGTLTVCYRRALFDEVARTLSDTWLMSDKPIWIQIAKQSNIKYFNKITSCYRVLEGTASHPFNVDKKINFIKNSWEISEYYNKLYNLNFCVKKDYSQLMKLMLIYGSRTKALKLLSDIPLSKLFSFKLLAYFLLTQIPCGKHIYNYLKTYAK